MSSAAFDWVSPPRVVDGLAVTVSAESVWRFLTYPEGRTPPERSAGRIADEIAGARPWVQARGVYRIDRPAGAHPLQLPLPEPPITPSNGNNEPVAFALALVTAGPMLEEQIRHRLAADDSVGALILDAVGSAAAEEAADRLTVEILDRLGERGASSASGYSGCRVSPGYGAWPLEAQRVVFQHLPHDEIGVGLLPSLLMVPRKSISFALWFDAEGRPISDLAGCARCPQTGCPQRR